MIEALSSTRRSLLGGVASGLLLPRSVRAAGLPHRLVGPVAVEQRRTLLGRPLSGFACKPVPQPVMDLEIEGAYTDRAFSIIDPDKMRRMLDAARPLGVFSTQVARDSDFWMMTRPMRPEPAACVMAWLDGWARAGAMLGRFVTPDAHHQRRWTLCGLSLAYLKVRDAPGLDPAARSRVEQWFIALADQASGYYGKWPREAYSNHICWWALALAATAVAANHEPMLDQAFTIYGAIISDIRQDGTLPLELARKGRALGYHVFALTPLVMIAEIGSANGHDLYATGGGAIHRLARRVLDGYTNSDFFAANAGAAQEPSDEKSKAFGYAWAEIYNARFPDPALSRAITQYRPIFYNWLGGSLTYDFGSPSLPFPS